MDIKEYERRLAIVREQAKKRLGRGKTTAKPSPSRLAEDRRTAVNEEGEKLEEK